MSKNVLIAIYFMIKCCAFASSDNPFVTIPDGIIEGATLQDFDGNNFFAFNAIPYAKPPLGELRFREAIANEPWLGIRNGTTDPPICTQPNADNSASIGQEDCLYLNVFTHSSSLDANKPVLLYIHGGKFSQYSGAFFGPLYLMTEDIVLVTLNYRLGIYGFVSYVDGDQPTNELVANNGFRDQLLAMKWVQRNIRYFGGDPNKITLAGESAGAISAHAHILSPLSTGLFHQATAMSGTALMVPSLADPNNVLSIASYLNYDITNTNEMIRQLKAASIEDLFAAQSNSNWFNLYLNPIPPLGLVIEKPAPNSFISALPLSILKSGHYNNVPMFMGMTNREGLLMQAIPSLAQDLSQSIPFFFDDQDEALEDVIDFYGINAQSAEENVTFFSDIWFHYNVIRTAIEHLKHSHQKHLYFYEFSGDLGLNFLKTLFPQIDGFSGACHADDLGYLFSMPVLPVCTRNSADDHLLRLMIKLHTNFVKYGKPTEDWKRFRAHVHNFGNITNSGLQLGVLQYQNYDFWEDMYEIYSNGLY